MKTAPEPFPTPAPAADRVGAVRRARTLTQDVVQGLTEEIRSERIRPGDKLPSEAEIMQTFGVSRGVVREALSRLQAAHLVVAHHGVGTFALEARQGGSVHIDTSAAQGPGDMFEVLELRLCLESESAAIAAVRRTPQHLEAMQQALAAFAEHIGAAGETVSPDFRFHLAIADATGNRYLADLMRQLGPAVIPRTRVPATRLDPVLRLEHLQRVHAEHLQIFEAIERGDPETARAAMRIHLANSRERQRRAQQALAAAGG